MQTEDERADEPFIIDEEEERKVRERVLHSGYALQHNRILTLEEKLASLLEMAKEEDKVWVPDVRFVGAGPTVQRVDIVRFNAALFQEIREYIAAIAAEMGERVKQKKVHVQGLPANVYINFDPNWDGIEQ